MIFDEGFCPNGTTYNSLGQVRNERRPRLDQEREAGANWRRRQHEKPASSASFARCDGGCVTVSASNLRVFSLRDETLADGQGWYGSALQAFGGVYSIS